ncbi:MAG: hypothetical protein P8179_00750 [Candidatus Thiodiazotropha sp.]
MKSALVGGAGQESLLHIHARRGIARYSKKLQRRHGCHRRAIHAVA